MKKKILITGGLGYIGSRLAKYFALTEKYFIRIQTHRDVVMPEWLEGRGEIIKYDFSSQEELDDLCEGISIIIHLAALNEINSQKNAQTALLVNSLGTLRLMQTALIYDIKRFIYISTAHVYGLSLEGHVNEKTMTEPISTYAITHKTAEDFILANNKKLNKMYGIVLRLSNGFGCPTSIDRNGWTLLVNDLCFQAVLNREIILKTNGLQKRNFISMSDIIGGIDYFCDLNKKKCLDGLFNLGGERTISIIEMAQLVSERCEKILGYKPFIKKAKVIDKNAYSKMNYSIEKLKSTGYRLFQNFEKEIDDTIKFCVEMKMEFNKKF